MTWKSHRGPNLLRTPAGVCGAFRYLVLFLSNGPTRCNYHIDIYIYIYTHTYTHIYAHIDTLPSDLRHDAGHGAPLHFGAGEEGPDLGY